MRYKSQELPANIHNFEEIFAWLRTEFLEIEAALDSLQTPRVNLVTQHAEPVRPREGDIVRADGTDWNPGGNEGVYEYTSGGTWNKL